MWTGWLQRPGVSPLWGQAKRSACVNVYILYIGASSNQSFVCLHTYMYVHDSLSLYTYLVISWIQVVLKYAVTSNDDMAIPHHISKIVISYASPFDASFFRQGHALSWQIPLWPQGDGRWKRRLVDGKRMQLQGGRRAPLPIRSDKTYIYIYNIYILSII